MSWKAHNLLYRSRPDLDQYAQGIVHNTVMLCYRVKMLPTEQGEFAMISFFTQDEGSPARSVFLSRYSRARCNVPSKVLAIAHATMANFDTCNKNAPFGLPK